MLRVLVADDAADIRLLVRVLLSSSSFNVVGEAATPEDAVQLTGDLQPDVIMTDHGFASTTTGLDIATLLHQAAPQVKDHLFSAYDNLHDHIHETPEIDAFVLKTDSHSLASVALRLAGPDPE